MADPKIIKATGSTALSIQLNIANTRIKELETALAARRAERRAVEAEQRIEAMGGFYSRTPREVEIQAALDETPESERDPADHAIAELLLLVDVGRNCLDQAEQRAEVAESRASALAALLAEAGAALDPMAACAIASSPHASDAELIGGWGVRVSIPTVGHCRRAADVLARIRAAMPGEATTDREIDEALRLNNEMKELQ